MFLSVYRQNSPFHQSCTVQVLKTYRHGRIVIAAVWRPWQRLLRCLFMKNRHLYRFMANDAQTIFPLFFGVVMRYIDRGVLCQIKHPAIIVSPFRTAALVNGCRILS